MFGQTERVESKAIGYDEKSPTYDLTPQYLVTRSMLSSEKKSYTNNLSKASLPKKGQIKNVTIDRIVKDPELINNARSYPHSVKGLEEHQHEQPTTHAQAKTYTKQESDQNNKETFLAANDKQEM